MADEQNVPQKGNPAEITAKELAQLVKQMRHNQRRYYRNPTPEKRETLERWEKAVDAIVATLTDTQLNLW